MTTNADRRQLDGSTLRRPGRRLRRQPAPVLTMAVILAVAGSMCLFAAAFPISAAAPVKLVAVVGCFLLVSSVVFLRFGAELPPWGLQAVAAAGTLINTLLVSACTTNYGATLNCFAFLWVAIYAGQFFEQRAVRLQCALIVIGSGVGLAISGIPGMITAWVLVAGSAAFAGEALARLNTRLRAQLITDPLTGLLNRAGFVAAAQRVRSLADREGLPVAIALIDLDEFKQVNDHQGHAAGDELLVELGRAWRQELRGSEVPARLGGDEFALVLAGAGRDGAAEALRRLRTASAADWSVGVVEWRRGESLDRAMARADEELYRAKRAARRLRVARREPGAATVSL